MVDKDEIMDILDTLYSDVEALREDGETDIRTVLRFISYAIGDIKKELEK